MFSYIRGTFIKVDDESVIIDVGGVGFEVLTTGNTLSKLPPVGDEIKLYSIMQVREDSITLIGFHSEDEKQMYKYLISVTGIGTKIALAILSSIDSVKLASLIISGDISVLATVKGIGKKTAERIVMELNNKLSKNADFFLKSLSNPVSDTNASSGIINDAIQALQSLGLSRLEAQSAIQAIPNRNDLSVEALIGEALRGLKQR
ncbi:MAG: Holliday junction branch migration protein RuvA [Christensenellaceae bacterium]|jgi:Holliday junction DNA helicase RuvA|nr:Holliday junction branch migration protein RuvA [Christensenellaceae bacterium]